VQAEAVMDFASRIEAERNRYMTPLYKRTKALRRIVAAVARDKYEVTTAEVVEQARDTIRHVPIAIPKRTGENRNCQAGSQDAPAPRNANERDAKHDDEAPKQEMRPQDGNLQQDKVTESRNEGKNEQGRSQSIDLALCAQPSATEENDLAASVHQADVIGESQSNAQYDSKR
jgi:hypothetical protein